MSSPRHPPLVQVCWRALLQALRSAHSTWLSLHVAQHPSPARWSAYLIMPESRLPSQIPSSTRPQPVFGSHRTPFASIHTILYKGLRRPASSAIEKSASPGYC